MKFVYWIVRVGARRRIVPDDAPTLWRRVVALLRGVRGPYRDFEQASRALRRSGKK